MLRHAMLRHGTEGMGEVGGFQIGDLRFETGKGRKEPRPCARDSR